LFDSPRTRADLDVLRHSSLNVARIIRIYSDPADDPCIELLRSQHGFDAMPSDDSSIV
jgi:hypothetical protein